MNDDIKKLIRQAVKNMLEKNSSPAKIKHIQKKHAAKVHFVPFQYRVFGGLLQSLNIQFGNFIEEMLHLIIENDSNVEIITDFSGKKNIKMPLSNITNAIIDAYISNCQTNPHIDLALAFADLRNQIIKSEITANNKLITKHDVDVLFRDKKTNIIYYVEIKYNDDHDTGKFVDINRKFIKTYAALLNMIEDRNENNFIPILYFFNPKRMKGNIYIDEDSHIRRGARLFDEFFELKYTDLEKCIKDIEKDEAVMQLFDNIYQKIRG